MAYVGSFAQCLTVAGQRLKEGGGRVVVLWQCREGDIWNCAAYEATQRRPGLVDVKDVYRYIILDYEMMRTILIWMAENILKEAS